MDRENLDLKTWCAGDVIGMPHFDLTTKASQYQGHGKVKRLEHIINHSKELAVPALRLLYEHLEKDSKDVQRARSVANTLMVVDKNSDNNLKTDWILSKQRQYNLEKQKLNDELTKASAEVYASCMAICYEKLADLAFEMGDFSDAQTYVSQQRDIMMEEDSPYTLFKLTLITYFGDKDSSAKSYAEKLAPAIVTPEGNLKKDSMATRVGSILGIYYLKKGLFRQAVAIFLNITLSANNDIITPEDMATYITLGALATFSRAELSFLSKSDPVFLALAEYSSQNFLDLISLLLNSKFAELFDFLDSYKVDYLLDPNLYDVLSELFHRIKVRSYVQYLSVFSNVSLDSMALDFNMSPLELEDQIKQLIESKTVNILIDQKHRTLVCIEEDTHFHLFQAANLAAERYILQSKTLLSTLL